MEVSNLLGKLADKIVTKELEKVSLPFEECSEDDSDPSLAYRNLEILFVKFESCANVLGFITTTSPISGSLRLIVGLIQTIVFTLLGSFHWLANSFLYANYEFNLVSHGLANILRGGVEVMGPIGNWLAILYSLDGKRYQYHFEGIENLNPV